jgi:hypothetical protein
MICIPFLAVKINCAILGFHLLVWCPKCTPDSSNAFIDTTANYRTPWYYNLMEDQLHIYSSHSYPEDRVIENPDK